jgi:hypothetical protein
MKPEKWSAFLAVENAWYVGYLRNGCVAGKAPGSFLHGKCRWTVGDADNSAPA